MLQKREKFLSAHLYKSSCFLQLSDCFAAKQHRNLISSTLQSCDHHGVTENMPCQNSSTPSVDIEFCSRQIQIFLIKKTCRHLKEMWGNYTPSKMLNSMVGWCVLKVASHPLLAILSCLMLVSNNYTGGNTSHAGIILGPKIQKLQEYHISSDSIRNHNVKWMESHGFLLFLVLFQSLCPIFPSK